MVASIHVLVADDHPHVRKQLAVRLAREKAIVSVLEASSSHHALDLIRQKPLDVLLIDPMMQDKLGFSVIRFVMEHIPHLAVVVLTAFPDTAFQMEMRQLGVKKILEKGIRSDELIQALFQVVA